MLRFTSLKYFCKTCDGKALHWKSYDNVSFLHLENIVLITYYCLFVFFFCPTRALFNHMETSPLPVKGCKSWQRLGTIEQWVFSCHTYCDTRQPFIMVNSRDPWYSHLLLNDRQWSCHYLFLRHRSVAAGIRTAIVYYLIWCVYQWIEIILMSC